MTKIQMAQKPLTLTLSPEGRGDTTSPSPPSGEREGPALSEAEGVRGNFALRIFAVIFLIFTISGCVPTYPKEKIAAGIRELCQKEYHISVDVGIAGNTLAIYLPVENLFDAMLSLDSKASKKINGVILAASRVALSTDAKFDFYVVFAQDPKMPEIELVYIRYVSDVKRFLLGDISRDEYAKRAVISIKTPPQAEREKILRELFAKLNVENAEEMIKEYLSSQEGISGIGDISYWDRKFFIKELGISEFLTSQIEERVKMEFRQDRDLNKWYELRSLEGKFISAKSGNRFGFNIDIANRAQPLYSGSGLEMDAYKKKVLVFNRMFGVISKVLWAYRFEDFERIEVSIPAQRLKIGREALWNLRSGRLKVEELL